MPDLSAGPHVPVVGSSARIIHGQHGLGTVSWSAWRCSIASSQEFCVAAVVALIAPSQELCVAAVVAPTVPAKSRLGPRLGHRRLSLLDDSERYCSLGACTRLGILRLGCPQRSQARHHRPLKSHRWHRPLHLRSDAPRWFQAPSHSQLTRSMVLTVTRATFQPERSELKAFALRNMLLFVPPTVALPGPDLPYAGSTEPFDGIERINIHAASCTASRI